MLRLRILCLRKKTIIIFCTEKNLSRVFPMLCKVGNVANKGLHGEEQNKFTQKIAPSTTNCMGTKTQKSLPMGCAPGSSVDVTAVDWFEVAPCSGIGKDSREEGTVPVSGIGVDSWRLLTPPGPRSVSMSPGLKALLFLRILFNSYQSWK